MHAHTPRKLTPLTRSKRSAGSSAASVGGAWMPALLTAMSSRPYEPTVFRTAPATAASSLTSHATARAWRPAAVTASVASRRASWLTSVKTTAAQASAKARAVARPMPELAPVTSATCPVKSYLGFMRDASAWWVSWSAALAVITRFEGDLEAVGLPRDGSHVSMVDAAEADDAVEVADVAVVEDEVT